MVRSPVKMVRSLGRVFENSGLGGEAPGGVWGGGPMASAPRPSNFTPLPMTTNHKYLIYIIKKNGHHSINIQLYKYAPTPGLYAIGLQSHGPYAISLLQYSSCNTLAVLHNKDCIQSQSTTIVLHLIPVVLYSTINLYYAVYFTMLYICGV